VYRYELANAIEDGNLAPFNYFPLDYWPTEEDGERINKVYKKVAARKKEGNPMSKAEIWTELARVYKTSRAKLPVFAEFLKKHSEVLDRCIIFVETIEYGEEVLEMVHKYKPDFHSYFGGEDQSVLERFANGDLECLLTCHRLSEGIDIRSLKNVILFSSARARLETIQRIGRCLRIDPLDPQKRAGIVDFVRADQEDGQDNDEHIPTDQLRRDWLIELSKIRPKAK
jgi:superfamily II DNA or RNA helicase